MRMKKRAIIGFMVVVILLIIGCIVFRKEKKVPEKKTYEILEHITRSNRNTSLKDDYSFDVKLIRGMNKYDNKTNYLISPYSIEVALNMVKQGAANNSYNEIENLIGSRKINDVSIKDRVSVTNGLFIKNDYKDLISNSFINNLLNDYDSDVIYDDFKNPNIINKWVNKSTKGMIPKLLEQIEPNFVLGIGNALAIDVEWFNHFDCSSTYKEKFTKEDNSSYDVEMMNNSYRNNIEYFVTSNSRGVIIPYSSYNKYTGEEFAEENEEQLEFIAILPNGGISEYIDGFNEDTMISIDKNKHRISKKLILSIPRFEYDYDLSNFKDLLKDLGIKDIFDAGSADFSKIIDNDKQKGNLYIGQAIHKTHISFNEKGTKAAAITYFSILENTAEIDDEEEPDKIVFNKPFVYMIRDKESKELLFFGVIYEPSKWEGSTCDE